MKYYPTQFNVHQLINIRSYFPVNTEIRSRLPYFYQSLESIQDDLQEESKIPFWCELELFPQHVTKKDLFIYKY